MAVASSSLMCIEGISRNSGDLRANGVQLGEDQSDFYAIKLYLIQPQSQVRSFIAFVLILCRGL